MKPTAAALAYGLEKKSDETIVVYDLGGGTFDVSVLEVGGRRGGSKVHQRRHPPGGDDVDQRIVDWLIDEFKKANNIDLSKDRMALQRLKESRGEGQVEAVADDGDGDQSSVRHRRSRRPDPLAGKADSYSPGAN